MPRADISSRYVDGEYAARNPSWHIEDSPFKARHILRALAMLPRPPLTICEIGCGAGEVLRQLDLQLPTEPRLELVGYDVSPQAIELARPRQSARTSFVCGDALDDERHFDVGLCIDVFEHIEDCFGFLKNIRRKADYFDFHIPLDLTCEALLRNFLMEYRRQYGHLHYFTRDTALAMLRECGYTLMGDFYTPDYECMPDNAKTRITKRLRRLIFAAMPRLSPKLIKGLHVMAVARASSD